ncbi:MAG: hypothetical protein R3B96_17655 [Pirellulaceae bacterium]
MRRGSIGVLELGRNPNTYVAVGNAQVELGHPELAERAWRQALEIAGDHPAAREKLARSPSRTNSRGMPSICFPLTESDFVSSSTSFLLQRAYALAGDEEKAKEWSEYTAEIRKRENLMNVVNSVLRSGPTSMWGRAIRAHMALSFQRYEDAEQLVATLPAEAQQQPFIARLVEAVEEHNPEKLPRFDELPVDLYQ